jgi:4-hydroxythreonine-4-phosphate dehydrogenase
LLSKLRILDQSLRRDFDIDSPRIAVLGLNPHSGDEGLLGTEERDIIKPALEMARQENIMALGPYAADGYFGSGLYQKFDAVLAMYHDQGLAPFKALSFDTGVNYTAGLPFVRTSPAHGTAYEIAGLDKASADSMRQAIYMAVDIYKSRKANRELKKNALGA